MTYIVMLPLLSPLHSTLGSFQGRDLSSGESITDVPPCGRWGYEALFKTKCHQCFRNLYRASNIYIRRPIYISDVQYIYPTSDIYIRHPGTYIRHLGTYIRRPISISDVRYIYWTSDIYIRRPIYNTRLRLGQGLGLGLGLELGQGYRTSHIDIGHPIYILDVRYIYWMSDIYIGRPI